MTSGSLTTMQKDLQLLLELQTVDYELGELERSKDYLPDMIQTLERQIREEIDHLKALETQLTGQHLEQKRLELETGTAQDELTRYQRQMRDIKTNKEYDALAKEIDKRKRMIADYEETLLKVMGNIEDLQEQIEQSKRKLAEVKKTNEVQLDGLHKEMANLGQKIKTKEDERKNITVRLDRSVIAAYERIRKGKTGQAVVQLRKKACSGCFKALPPQRVQEIKRGDSIITCDNCGRLLIWAGEE